MASERKPFPLELEIPMLDAWDEADMARLTAALSDCPFGGDRSRPYLGQSWTYAGERGQYEVSGLTLRDVGDCVMRALADMRPDADPVAVVQNVLCNVERLMGIFPNVPGPDTGGE